MPRLALFCTRCMEEGNNRAWFEALAILHQEDGVRGTCNEILLRVVTLWPQSQYSLLPLSAQHAWTRARSV